MSLKVYLISYISSTIYIYQLVCILQMELYALFVCPFDLLPWYHNIDKIVIELDIMMTSTNGNMSALLAICAGNSSVIGEFPAQRPVTRSFDVFFDLRPN